jgi:hypothetical protein
MKKLLVCLSLILFSSCSILPSKQTEPRWESILNVWDCDLTKEQAQLMNDFIDNSVDSVWTSKDDGWVNVHGTNTAFDTVVVQETSPEGVKGHQMLYWKE